MEYTDTAGQPAQGDVWSPGPMAATVWVLVAGGGHAVVHVATRREVPEDRWLGRAGSASSKGPTLSPKLWREALGFDPRAVVRGEVEQPELVACDEPTVADEPADEPGATPDEPPAAAPVADQPEPAPVVPPLPVGTRVRIRVDLAGRDAVVIGAAVEDGRVKVRCEDTVGSVWLLDLRQVSVVAGPEVGAAREPAVRIDYRRPAGARRDRRAAYRIDYRKPARGAASCAALVPA